MGLPAEHCDGVHGQVAIFPMAEVLLDLRRMAHLEHRMKRVLALQVALDRAGFSPGEIDAHGSANTERALRAFQQAHGLHVTGELDRKTIRTLGQPFVRSVRTYQITGNDLETALDWTSMADMLAERFHTSPALLRYLNTDAAFEEGETLLVPNVEPFAVNVKPAAPVVVTVAERAHMLSVQNANGEVIFHAPLTTAGDDDAFAAVPTCLPRVSVGGIRLTSWDAMRLACLMNGTAKVVMR
jgi:peptidoglycan hydrolase-like protein with peptidoglycan-binding domain